MKQQKIQMHNNIIEFLNNCLEKEPRVLDALIETKRVFNLTDNDIVSIIDANLLKKLKKQELEYKTIIKRSGK